MKSKNRGMIGWLQSDSEVLGTVRRCVCVTLLTTAIQSTALAQIPDWIELKDETCSRINADPSVIVDFTCGSSSAACEKDFAVGDLDKDGDDDVVMVRMGAFRLDMNPVWAVHNVLFLSDGGVMHDQTALLAPQFGDTTIDRDVLLTNVNVFEDTLLDVVTVTTRFDQPRVYMNQGCCAVTCDPLNPCPQGNKVACTSDPGVNWCGLLLDSARLPTFSPPPRFCGGAAGDVNGDGCPDLYFVDYDNMLEDRLLINQKVGGVCTGPFLDETQTRVCLDPNDAHCFNVSDFGTAAQIIDLNGDLCNDIIKSQNGSVTAVYNTKDGQGNCTGDFTGAVIQMLSSGGAGPYTTVAGDINNDMQNDVYIVKDLKDAYRINTGGGVFAPEKVVDGSPKVDSPGGSVRMADMNSDLFLDVLVSDMDVEDISCPTGRELAILRTEVNPLDPLDVTIVDPLSVQSRVWNTVGTFDTAVLDVNSDGKSDLWSGNCGGNKLFIQDSTAADCNGNRVSDACDIANATSNDCNQNGVPDECEGDPEGACCMGGGLCEIKTSTCCADAGGTFMAGVINCQADCDGTPVANICQVPTNACCLLTNGMCVDTTQACCAA